MTIRLISFVSGFIIAVAAAAQAQDYSAGKTPAQLFASDCSGCHKSPQGLAKTYDASSLAGFLREHYTSKKETAGALAAYIAGAGGAPPQGAKPGGRSRTAAPATEPKPAEETGKPSPSAGIPRIFPWQAGHPTDARPDAEAPREDPKATGRRRTAAPSESKDAEPSTPAIIRHQGGSRPAIRRPPPAEAAKPVDAKPLDAQKPAADKPADVAKPTETRPAEPPQTTAAVPADTPADKLKSYLESGQAAKAPEAGDKPSGDKPVETADPRVSAYATSGDTAMSKATASAVEKPAADKAPNDRKAPEDDNGGAKPSADDKAPAQ